MSMESEPGSSPEKSGCALSASACCTRQPSPAEVVKRKFNLSGEKKIQPVFFGLDSACNDTDERLLCVSTLTRSTLKGTNNLPL